jgi:hypothetical protein
MEICFFNCPENKFSSHGRTRTHGQTQAIFSSSPGEARIMIDWYFFIEERSNMLIILVQNINFFNLGVDSINIFRYIY